MEIFSYVSRLSMHEDYLLSATILVVAEITFKLGCISSKSYYLFSVITYIFFSYYLFSHINFITLNEMF